MKKNQFKAVILNSRQGLRPIGIDPWIRKTDQVVCHAVSKNYHLLTSVGMNSWEVVLYFASRYKAFQTIYIPLAKKDNQDVIKEYYTKQFRLISNHISWKFIETDSNNKHQLQQLRDKIILADSDLIYPVSIKPDGNLYRLIDTEIEKPDQVDYGFKTEYLEKPRKLHIKIDIAKLNPEIDNLLNNYLIHWTRAFSHPWPAETLYDFYNAIILSKDTYSRNGLETLAKIISEKKLRASSRHLRKTVSAVAFSALKPGKAVELMKWRARYREMSFEPYGIAIEKKQAEKIGIRKVFYGNPEMYNYIEKENRPYFQSLGTLGNWRPEKEYRHIGDIDLNKIPAKYLTVIVWEKSEIERLKTFFNGKIVSFYNE